MASYWTLIADPNLVLRYNGDGNGDSTPDAINAVEPGIYDGTWGGVAQYGTGPFGLNSFDLDGSSYVQSSNIARSLFTNDSGTLDAGTLAVRFKASAPASTAVLLSLGQDGTWTRQVKLYYTSSGEVGLSSNQHFNTHTSETWTDGDWHSAVATWADNTNPSAAFDLYIDGETKSHGTNTAGFFSSATNWTVVVGGSNSLSQLFDNEEAEALAFNRQLTSTEAAEWDAGPEPTYTASASLGTDGAIDVGEWEDYDNGSISYEWKVLDSELNEIGSGTGTTGTVTPLATGLHTLHVRASNLGDYDEGDGLDGLGGGNGYYKVAEAMLTAGDPPDETAPELVSATVDGDEWTIEFSENVTGQSGFSATGSVSGSITLTGTSGDESDTHTFTGSPAVEHGETVTLSYSPGNVVDDAENALEEFSDAAVVNATPPPPAPTYWGLAAQSVLHELLDGSTTGSVTGTTQFAPAQFKRQAFAFDGATRIDLPETIEIEGTASVLFRVRTDALASGTANLMGYRLSSDITALAYREDLSPDAWRSTRPTQGTHTLSSNPGTGSVIDSNWRTVCWISTLTGSEVYQDGVKVGGLSGLTSAGTWKFQSIGAIDGTIAFVGEIADVMILDWAVTVEEMLAYMEGPDLPAGLHTKPLHSRPLHSLQLHSLAHPHF